MLITEQNLKIWYNEYKKQRERSEKYVKSRKGETRGLEVSSFSDFKVDFVSIASDAPSLSGKDIAKKMAKEEVYAVSYQQALTAAKAYSYETGEKLTGALVNRFRTNLWSLVKQRRQELKQVGSTNKEIEFVIGHEFFGSK